jgi:hypothetical protein
MMHRWCVAAVLLLSVASPGHPQVVPTTTIPVDRPWNAQQIFEPSPPPDALRPDEREPTAPEDVPVMKRVQPGYAPAGIRSGSWMFNPSVTTGALYDSNVFATTSNPQSDIAAMIQPNLRAHTLWERHGLDLQLGAQSYFYKDHPGLDQTSAGIKGNGWIDVRHDAQILTSFQVAHLFEGVGTLSSPGGAVKPTPYDLFSGDVTYRQEFQRLALAFGTRIDSYSYGSTQAQNGTPINEDNRDGQIYRVHGRADYTLSPKFGLFTAVEANRRELRGSPGQPLSSDGYRVLTGADIELTHLLTGEFAAGYVNQRFDDRMVGTAAGPTFRAMLTWHPTRLMDVNFKVERFITETAETTATPLRADAVQLGVDYELRRNVIFSVVGAYEFDKFLSLARNDRVASVGTQIKYMLSEFGFISLEHKYVRRDSDVPLSSFDKNQVMINVTAQF